MLVSKPGWLYVSRIPWPTSIIILSASEGIFYVYLFTYMLSDTSSINENSYWVSGYVIIIIMSSHQHGYPWTPPWTPPYRPSLPVGHQGCIPYLHRAAVCMFEMVALHFLGHVKGSTRVHHLWARPHSSSSVLHSSRLILHSSVQLAGRGKQIYCHLLADCSVIYSSMFYV